MAKASFSHFCAFITRFGSVFKRGLTAPGSLKEYAVGVCLAARVAFDREVLRTASGVSTNPNSFVIARFACAPDFDGKELEHVNLRSGYASGEEIPVFCLRKNRGARSASGLREAIVLRRPGY